MVRRVPCYAGESESCSVVLTLCDPMDYTIHGSFLVRILEWVAVPSPGDLPNPGIKPRSPALEVDSLPAEPPFTGHQFNPWSGKTPHVA